MFLQKIKCACQTPFGFTKCGQKCTHSILEPFTSDNFEVEHHVVDPKPFVLGCSTNPYIIYQLARKSVFGQKHCHAYALTLGEWFIPKIN